MIKKIAVVASILLLTGIVGSVFTFKSIYEAEDVTEEKVLHDDFNDIEVTTDNTKVEFLPSSDSEARVELSGKDSNYHLLADVEESTLKVDVVYKQRKLYNFDFTLGQSALKIYVPEKKYDSLQTSSDNGQIRVGDLQAKNIHLTTDNGRIQLNNIQSDEITTEADNGAIDLKAVAAADVKMKADNGKITLDDVEGKLSGKTNNGSISLITSYLDRPIDFETNNGKITIQTEAEPTNVIFDVKVNNGKIDIFGKKNWDTVVGDGEHLIKLTAENGMITVAK